VAINKSRYYKRDDGLAIGTGAFVAALGKRRLFLHIWKQPAYFSNFQYLFRIRIILLKLDPDPQ
jgi:hypothetical protein